MGLYTDRMNRRNALCVLGGLLAGGNRGLACLWDTDTLSDEVATQASSLDLILGQFPHQRQWRLKWLEGRLTE